MRESDAPSEAMKLEFTKHAVHVLDERKIPVEWVEQVMAEPALRTPGPNDPDVERFLSPHPGTWWSRAARRRKHTRCGLAGGVRSLWPQHERRTIKLNVDKEADALCLRLDDSTIVESEEVSPGVVLDYNESNEVVGVELLHLSKRSSKLNLSTLQFETV